MKTGQLAALLLLVACGGTVAPNAEDSGIVADGGIPAVSDAVPPDVDAAPTAPDATPDADVDAGPDVPECFCRADGFWCDGIRAPVEVGCLKCSVWCEGGPDE